MIHKGEIYEKDGERRVIAGIRGGFVAARIVVENGEDRVPISELVVDGKPAEEIERELSGWKFVGHGSW